MNFPEIILMIKLIFDKIRFSSLILFHITRLMRDNCCPFEPAGSIVCLTSIPYKFHAIFELLDKAIFMLYCELDSIGSYSNIQVISHSKLCLSCLWEAEDPYFYPHISTLPCSSYYKKS